MERKGIYLEKVLNTMPRILTQLNRSAPSKTYGCFDRDYWHYLTTDFPSMRKQEAVLTLAYAYTLKHSKNKYYQSATLKRYINASLKYWTKTAKKELSEWYPGEDSFVCNTFNLYAITQTYIVLKEHPSKKTLSTIEKIARKVSRTKESRVQNQYTSVPIGLYNTFLLTKNEWYKKQAEEVMNILKQLQHVEGWFLEYGGADIGYLSLAVHYIAHYYEKTRSAEAFEVVKKSCAFLQYFLHPDYTSGGEYASRNTEYLIPTGFEIFASEIKDASVVAQFIREGLRQQKIISPEELDDRYLLYLHSTYFESFLCGQEKMTNRRPPHNTPFIKKYETLGIHIHNTKEYYMVINAKKGGAFQYINKRTGKHVYDSGIVMKTKIKTFTSSYLHEPTVWQEKNTITIKGNLTIYKEQKMTTKKLVLLRLFFTTVGRISFIKKIVKEYLRDILITKNKLSKMYYKRNFILDEKEVVVRDEIVSPKKMKEVLLEEKYSNTFVPSSRLYQEQTINVGEGKISALNSKSFKITRTY